MPLGYFHSPVPIRTIGPGDIRCDINHIQAAREQLLQWPNRGPKWYLAADACLAAIDGKVPPDEVRKVFVEAAMEAGFLLLES
ncbi:hypothetical protein X743_08725 [Mesorhizobium sp. LNHC252B00]|uniref:DUF982 domain-containing protein n=1 Tax=Mesorhizobium sp. LNHC252B00 TaxID=1287252 RepID=UPI0003CF4663|nr:DUF982 domain-containing protein [Mesorhizobium sp. LNHC252B00]ESY73713.1 hypothetical protein X743_08725 [Mesorhizobium sp. LNHC252B00]